MLIILGFGASLGLNKEEIYAFGGMMVSLVLISFSVTAFVYNKFGSVSVKAREIYSMCIFCSFQFLLSSESS